jgi:hypothetical protein
MGKCHAGLRTRGDKGIFGGSKLVTKVDDLGVKTRVPRRRHGDDIVRNGGVRRKGTTCGDEDRIRSREESGTIGIGARARGIDGRWSWGGIEE